jgi:tetratricopeptide (TPR) repeat protein
MTDSDALLHPYEQAETWQEAERALDAVAAAGPSPEIPLGDFYDDVATELAEQDDFEGAVQAQRKALEHGCEFPELGREMLGWYLLMAGRRDEAEAQFDELRAERGDDPELDTLVGSALLDAGHPEDALAAFDRALAFANAGSDDYALRRARSEREGCRAELGLPPDADDHIARDARAPFLDESSESVGEPVQLALAWFPRDQHSKALEHWPDLRDDLHDADAYCRMIETRVREAATAAGRHPVIAPLEVERLVAYAREQGLDPNSGKARAGFAAAAALGGAVLEWPPGRNEPCWCGSGRKYKRCCGNV